MRNDTKTRRRRYIKDEILVLNDNGKRWVAVDNLIQRLIGASVLDICRIIKELKQGEEDKEVENGKSINKNVR